MPPKPNKHHLFRVWRPDYDEPEEGAREYGCHDMQNAAKYHASYCHRHLNGWEWSWPVTFRVKQVSTGKTFDVEVERHMVPEFEAGTPTEVRGE